jgi:CelD/BcsL family acetyltransferase involved in cellulose biosynthesis
LNAPATLKGAGAHAIDVAVAETVDAFAALEKDWDALYDRSGRANPFLSYAWARACFDEEGGGAEPFILTLRRGGQLIGVAPLCIERRLGFRVLRFIAEGRSDYLAFLCEPETNSVERRLLAELTNFAKAWDLLVLRNLAEPFTSLHRAGKPGELRWHQVRWSSSAYCRWDGDWESLHHGGPSWFKLMRKRRRRFLKDASIRCFTGGEAAERLDIVAAIEGRSWKAREAAARLQPGPGQEILRRAFLSKDSQVELWLAFAGDEAIAFQIDFATPERLWLYQYAYNEAFASLSAGSYIQYTSIEQAWQSGAREYDLMMGEESYKASRTTAIRPIHSLAGHRRTLRGWLAYSLLLAPRWKLRHVAVLQLMRARLKRLRRLVSR